VGPISSTSLTPGTCLTHGYHGGAVCPSCSTHFGSGVELHRVFINGEPTIEPVPVETAPLNDDLEARLQRVEELLLELRGLLIS
jgi:hypothetical protein